MCSSCTRRSFLARATAAMGGAAAGFAARTFEVAGQQPPSPTIPARAMMRELQNVIERVIILLPGPTLRLALDELQPNRPGPGSRARVRTLEEVERRHILQVLRNTNWVMADRTVPPHFGVKPTPDSSARRSLTFLCGRRDRMRQIEAKALEKLRQASCHRRLQSFLEN